MITPRPNLPPDQTAIEDAAIAWLSERDDGFTAERAREFAAWCKADPRHPATLARMEKILSPLAALPAFRPELNRHFGRQSPPRPRAFLLKFPALRQRATWVGVGLAAALVLGVLGFRSFHAAPSELRYATAAAGYERVRLGDGSTLELNAASAVRTHFTAAERSVQLDAGEAHFAVSHDPTRPFVVHAGGVVVRAVGTAFNVRYTAGAVEVIVVEGKVRVESTDPAPAPAATPPLVSAGERLVVSSVATSSPPHVEKMAPAALSESLAWQRRLVDFADEPLREIVRQFNLHNRVQLELADSALGAQRIGGTFARDEVEAFVRLLERDGEIVAERRGDDTIVLRRR
jgi:transmembrane sensor